ncbi:MAG TPA: PPOX class F420-dependent oxidoreductase [Candidatus Limnocylindrales bacterium]|nr:PPOX class F420-dependent oxidoreductase [Candidatus Limnocylindrales bacterium]
MPSLDTLANSPYAMVTTFRKDGRAVGTPVWIVPFENGLAIWTVTTFGKVKRIRRNPHVTVATCDLRGNNVGEAAEATARILDGAGTAAVRDALRKKYGIWARLTLWGSRIRRGLNGTVGIQIDLTAPGQDS